MAIPKNLRVSALVEYSSPYRDPATVLAFVDTGDVQKVSNGSRRGSKKTMRPRRVRVRGTLLTLRAGWPHRPEALGFIIRTGPAVIYSTYRPYESG